jgi:D-glycerate 3-kinase
MITTPVLSDSLIQPIVTFIESLNSSKRPIPLVLGISGPQGSGKTTLVHQLAEQLSSPPTSLRIVSFSIDDIYLPHDELVDLGRRNSENKLLQHRGEPGTHDIKLGIDTIDSLLQAKPTAIPSYDKSRFSGQGDRVPSSEWSVAQPPFDVILFEGWCVGFQALSPTDIAKKWLSSVSPSTLLDHALEHLQFVNGKLEGYSCLWDRLDALVWLRAQDIDFAYEWRIQQEHAMKAALGSGMSDDQVRTFVDGYMPAYELYIDGLMRGDLFRGKTGCRILRIDYDRNRAIMAIKEGDCDKAINWADS